MELKTSYNRTLKCAGFKVNIEADEEFLEVVFNRGAYDDIYEPVKIAGFTNKLIYQAETCTEYNVEYKRRYLDESGRLVMVFAIK